MAKLVSNVYGDALFELAVESGRVDDFLKEAEGVIEVVKKDDGFSQMMNHPKINIIIINSEVTEVDFKPKGRYHVYDNKIAAELLISRV